MTIPLCAARFTRTPERRVLIGSCGLVLTAVLLRAARFTRTAARWIVEPSLGVGAVERLVAERVTVARRVLGRALLGRD